MSDKEEEKKKEVPPEDREGDAIKRFEDAALEKPSTRMELLDSFLKQITGAISVQPKTGPEDFQDIQSIEWTEYPELESSENLEKKIAELKLIADSIEKKNYNRSSLSKT